MGIRHPWEWSCLWTPWEEPRGISFAGNFSWGYPRWIMHSPPLSSSCSSRSCMMKFPSWNVQESQSLAEQGTKFSAPAADEPQKHEVVLALHFSVEELRKKQEGQKTPLQTIFFYVDHTSHAIPFFLLSFWFPWTLCLKMVMNRKWSGNTSPLTPTTHCIASFVSKTYQGFFKVWKSMFLTAAKDTVSH